MSKPDKEIINLPVVAPAREVKKLKQQCYTFARDFRRKAADNQRLSIYRSSVYDLEEHLKNRNGAEYH